MILFDEEFSKYPISFLRKIRLRDVSFVSNLSLNGEERSALPDFKREILFYDFLRGDSNTTYQRHVIHHEFYHMIEEDINSDVYWKDPNWAKLNKPGYKYSIDKRMAEENSSEYKFSHPEQGFLNLYSKSALEEDKAEIFASIFVKEEYKKVREWIKNDEILSNKVKYMKAFLLKVDTSFNESYWNKLHNSNNK